MKTNKENETIAFVFILSIYTHIQRGWEFVLDGEPVFKKTLFWAFLWLCKVQSPGHDLKR